MHSADNSQVCAVFLWSEAAEIHVFSSDSELDKGLSLSLYTLHLKVCDASLTFIIKSAAF